MKKIFPIFIAVMLFVSACQFGGSGPGAISIPEANATLTAVAPGQSDTNATAGKTRVSPADGMIEVFIPALRRLPRANRSSRSTSPPVISALTNTTWPTNCSHHITTGLPTAEPSCLTRPIATPGLPSTT